MKKKSKLLYKKSRIGTNISLQITSMADIFIIILVFLLKSYASGSLTLNASKGVILPTSGLSDAPAEALKVEVSQNSVLIENNPVASLKNYEVSATDILSNGSSKSLNSIFEKERRKQMVLIKNSSTLKVDSRIILIADKRVPYQTIKAILASAGLSGYTDFKLAVNNN